MVAAIFFLFQEVIFLRPVKFKLRASENMTRISEIFIELLRP